MPIINYRGVKLQISTSKDVHDLLQLFGQHITGLSKDLAQLVADHAQTADKIKQSGAISPLSLASMFPALSSRATVQPATPAPVPVPVVPTPSPHRSGSPTGTTLDSSLNQVQFHSNSTDRAHSMTLDFSAAFTATNPVARVTFNTPYSSVPVVILQQNDSLASRNFEPILVDATGYTFTCNAFGSGELHIVQAIVVHPSESFD